MRRSSQRGGVKSKGSIDKRKRNFQTADVVNQVRLHNNSNISLAYHNKHLLTCLQVYSSAATLCSGRRFMRWLGSLCSTCLSFFWDQQTTQGMFFSHWWQKPEGSMWKLTMPFKSQSHTGALPLLPVFHWPRWVTKLSPRSIGGKVVNRDMNCDCGWSNFITGLILSSIKKWHCLLKQKCCFVCFKPYLELGTRLTHFFRGL